MLTPETIRRDGFNALSLISFDFCGLVEFGQLEKVVEIRGRLAAGFFRRKPANLAHLPGHFLYKRGLVAFAAMGHRRQKGLVGFNQQALQRYFFRSIADGLRLGEG